MAGNKAVAYEGPGRVEVHDTDYPTFELKDGLKFASALEGSFVVLFVDLHRDGETATIARIAEFLGVEASPEDLARIEAEFSFDAMRERSAAIADQDPETLLRGINDPQTLMHANHVDKGVHRDWRSELTEEQVASALERFAPYLQHA